MLRSERVVTGDEVSGHDVVLRGAEIEAIEAYASVQDVEVEELGRLVVMPSLIDAHVHINEPGRTDWEGFACATRAAASGGITVLVDMPLNSSPVTTSLAALREKRSAARDQCHVDVGFYGGLVPENAFDASALESLVDAGVLGLKAFLCDSGIDEFPPVGRRELEAAMPVLARRGVPLLAHAEIADGPVCPAGTRSYSRYVASRPPRFEHQAISLLIDLCRRTGCPVHIVHLAAAECLPEIAAAKEEGLPLTVETCPHYLYFAAEEVLDGDTRFKCAPPIRDRENRERLWQGLEAGIIDGIASDHSPCLPALKGLDEGDFGLAWGGISSLELTLSIVWTRARQRGHSLNQIVTWLRQAPSRWLGLAVHGDRLAPGVAADLVVWDPEASFEVVAQSLHHRHPITPYAGQQLQGVVRQAFLRGRRVAPIDKAAPRLGKEVRRRSPG